MWKSKSQWSVHQPHPRNWNRFWKRSSKGIRQGGLGVGTPIGYATAGLNAYEVNQAWRLAGKYGLFATVHGRFSSQALPTEGILGTLEAIASASMHGAGILVHHYQAQVLSAVEDVARMVDQASESGVKVLLEMYPYTFGSSVMMADYLASGKLSEQHGPHLWRHHAGQDDEAFTKETYEEEVKKEPGATILFEHCKEEDMVKAMAWPSVCLGSDAVPYIDGEGSKDAEGGMTVPYDCPDNEAHGHPRNAGTYAKVFRYVREQKVMPLMTAVAKSSYQLCKFMADCGVPQMAAKGRMQVGCDADITIFDPDTITDNATRENGVIGFVGNPLGHRQRRPRGEGF